jgi:NTE family protein
MIKFNKFHIILAMFTMILSYTNTIWAESLNDDELKIGLALSGGGARGIAHIGVIIALEEEGIPIDMIAGSSMGSIVGGLYAAGYNGKEIRELVGIIDWESIFLQDPEPDAIQISKRYGLMEPLIRLRFDFWDIYIPFGFNNAQRISEEIFRYTAPANFAAKSNFDNLTVPYRAIVVDASTGETLALDEGDLTQAIRGSMAIPLVFYPARFDGRLMIDGGVLNLLPTDVVEEMGADIIIGVDVQQSYSLDKEPKHLVDIASHTIDIMIGEMKKENVKRADVLIEPQLGAHSSSTYRGLDSLITLGYKATMEKMDEIKVLVPGEFRDKQISQMSPDMNVLEQATVGYAKLVGIERVQRSVVTTEFTLREGDIFDMDQAVRGIQNVYATGLFENVWLELRYIDEHSVGIIIHVVEKYPRTIGIGARYDSEEGLGGFVQIVNFNLFGWGERFMPLFRYGDVYKRIGVEIVNDRFFSTPLTLHNGFYFERESQRLYDTDGSHVDEFDVDRLVSQFSLGVQPHKKFITAGGVRLEKIWLTENRIIGQVDETIRNWSLFGHIMYDNRDNIYFPRRGVLLLLEGEHTMGIKSGNDDYSRYAATASWVIPFPRGSMVNPYIKYQGSDNNLPVYDQYRYGSMREFSGYRIDELRGSYSTVLGINTRVHLYKLWHFESGVYTGQVVDNSNDFRLHDFTSGFYGGLTADLPIGPLSIIYGRSDRGNDRVYVSVGYNF